MLKVENIIIWLLSLDVMPAFQFNFNIEIVSAGSYSVPKWWQVINLHSCGLILKHNNDNFIDSNNSRLDQASPGFTKGATSPCHRWSTGVRADVLASALTARFLYSVQLLALIGGLLVHSAKENLRFLIRVSLSSSLWEFLDSSRGGC